MADIAPRPILDLSTVIHRQVIAIDGRRYELRDASEITIEQQAYLERTMPRLGALLINISAGAADHAKRQDADRILRHICEMAIDAPAKVLDALQVTQRIAVVRVFLKLPTPTAEQTEAILKAAMGRESTGVKSSRHSSGRTAAIHSGGTRRSRSTSSDRT